MKAREALIALWLQYNGNWDKIYDALVNKTRPNKTYINKAEQMAHKFYTIIDEDYPLNKYVYKPLFVVRKD